MVVVRDIVLVGQLEQSKVLELRTQVNIHVTAAMQNIHRATVLTLDCETGT